MSKLSTWVEENPNKFYLSGLCVVFVIGFLIGFTGFYDVFTEDQVDSILSLVTWVVMIPVSIITLVNKGRSLWWMLLWGLFSPLWLKNKKFENKESVSLINENSNLKSELSSTKNVNDEAFKMLTDLKKENDNLKLKLTEVENK